MKSAIELAREFIRTVDALNSVPGLMTSHDLGKEAMARWIIEHSKPEAAKVKRLFSSPDGFDDLDHP